MRELCEPCSSANLETDNNTMDDQDHKGYMVTEHDRLAPTGSNPNRSIVNPHVIHAGIDTENETIMYIVPAVPDKKQDDEVNASCNLIKANPSNPNAPMPCMGITVDTSDEATPGTVNILDLPSELLHSILCFMTPVELSIVTQVCQKLHEFADSDFHWQRHVLANLPCNRIASPYPFETWRELYACHDPYWFIPKHKIWFSDRDLPGQIIIAQYDQRRGVIEGYQLVGERHDHGSDSWEENGTIHIHMFQPKVRLHRDKPVLRFTPGETEKSASTSIFNFLRRGSGRAFAERAMSIDADEDPQFSKVSLAKPLEHTQLQDIRNRTDDFKEFPYGYIWPPPRIPAQHRVLGAAMRVYSRSESPPKKPVDVFIPRNRCEASDQIFHVRQWMERGPGPLAVPFSEQILTFSTLDPCLYTPTAEKPWRGIWVGDYSGHGAEFLLIHQPDDEGDENKESLQRHDSESDEEFNERFLRERVYKGRLEAIKLTGDPNVPRGEHTFIADDIGEGGFISHSTMPAFEGARVVESRGHIASMGFLYDKFMESQLILQSYDRLAQFWVGFGHVSFFERVNIDKFLVPE